MEGLYRAARVGGVQEPRQRRGEERCLRAVLRPAPGPCPACYHTHTQTGILQRCTSWDTNPRWPTPGARDPPTLRVSVCLCVCLSLSLSVAVCGAETEESGRGGRWEQLREQVLQVEEMEKQQQDKAIAQA
eukprot:2702325-Rhodomonas_salina.1